MAVNDDGKACRYWIQVEFRKIVQKINRMGADRESISGGDVCDPFAFIIVAAHRSYRGNGCEGFQHRRITYISSVEYQLRAQKSVQGLSAHQAMSIGNQADQIGRASVS